MMNEEGYNLIPFMKLPSEYKDTNLGHKIFERLQTIAVHYLKKPLKGELLLDKLNELIEKIGD